MPKTKLHAGAFLEGTRSFLLQAGYEKEKVDGLLRSLSAFEAYSDQNLHPDHHEELHPFLAVLDNLVTRGLPTLSSYPSAKKLTEKLPYLKEEKGESELYFSLHDPPSGFAEGLFRALHAIDPWHSMQNDISSYEDRTDPDSPYEKAFLEHFAEKGSPLAQLMEPQRNLEEILRTREEAEKELKRYIEGNIETFPEQAVDFALELPYPLENDKTQGRVIEIDGSHHREGRQQYIDENRDHGIELANWGATFRFKAENGKWENWEEEAERLQKEVLNDPQLEIFRQNLQDPLVDHETGQEALYHALIPFGIARIQKTLLRSIMNGSLSLDAEKWRIEVIERDVPCADLAIEELKVLLRHLATLAPKEAIDIPPIELRIQADQRYQPEPLRLVDEEDESLSIERTLYQESPNENPDADLSIDLSILQRGEPIRPEKGNGERFVLRTAPSFGRSEGVLTSRSIEYDPIVDHWGLENLIDIKKGQALSIFLKSIFRKRSFWRGQLDILDRSLQKKNVVGLLPTGAGKSLTFQLSGLLQPGISLVVAPLKPLMKNQVENLQRSWIDREVTINSDLSPWERNIKQNRFTEGAYQFCYISPERLLIEEFLHKVRTLPDEKGKGFAYGIIDEVHCVSEWGHDFKPAYLKIGENLRKFCRTRKDHPISLMGLTATASFDVLSDVQRELRIGDDAVIRLEKLRRDELHYEAIPVEVNDEELEQANAGFGEREVIDQAKLSQLIKTLERIPTAFQELRPESSMPVERIDQKASDGSYPLPGVVFSPYKSENVTAGVRYLSGQLEEHFDRNVIGYYHGGGNNLDEAQQNTLNHNLDAYLNGEKSLMLATKAFGMGVDKRDIRYTIHFNYPNSIESLVQESGRAGRDGGQALAYVLFAEKEPEKEVHMNFLNNSFKGNRKETKVIGDLLQEISFPQKQRTELLNEGLTEEFGKRVELRFGRTRSPLFVNHVYRNNYGRVHMDPLKAELEQRNTQLPEEERRKVVDRVVERIQNECPSDRSPYEWLTEQVNNPKEGGIIPTLEGMQEGESSTLLIGFRNNKFQQIAQLVGGGCTETIVESAAEFSNENDDFPKELRREFYNAREENLNIPEDKRKKVQNLFEKTRNPEETLKAVYRLACIGVVDDFTIDFRAGTVKAVITKRTGSEYLQALRDYLSRYYSHERVEQETKELRTYTEDPYDTIRQCLRVLVDFVYDEIRDKRKEAINVIEATCQTGKSNGPEAFTEEIWNIFDSQFFQPLSADTDNAREFDEALIWRYIDEECEGIMDNVKHLGGAALRLLPENPNNGAILILAAYARFFSPNENLTLLSRAKDHLERGIIAFKEYKGYRDADCLNLYQKVHDKLEQQIETVPEELKEVKDYLALKFNADRLEALNRRLEKRDQEGLSETKEDPIQ